MMENQRATLTVKELSEILGLSLNTTYGAIHSLEIPYFKVGSKILILKSQFYSWLDGKGVANHGNEA